MAELFSWIVAGIIALGALVGFTGVVATSVLTVVRRLTGAHPARASRRELTTVS
jgi:hypothetical protein